MPADTSGLKAYVLVDGRAVPELVDPDAAPRDWAWLRQSPGQVSPEAAKNCGKQHKCLVATTAGTLFEIVLINDTRHHLCIDTYVDGQKLKAGGDARTVLVKPPGGQQEELPRSSWRLGGGGPRSRRGAHVVEQQAALLVQAFANAFGVRVFMLCVTGKKKQLRVVRVEPRNGRRVLINGYAIAHLGGVAFDSIERHHEIIEIQGGSESEEEEDVKPDPEPPAKRQRAGAPRVKRARR